MSCGVLLIGAPGRNKTLLVKMVAGEAKVIFYSISGSDFVEMFIGVGAAQVVVFLKLRRNMHHEVFLLMKLMPLVFIWVLVLVVGMIRYNKP